MFRVYAPLPAPPSIHELEEFAVPIDPNKEEEEPSRVIVIDIGGVEVETSV
tara:strand:+ start:112 stop:264 length:153 start_codon:yes stop_codon:yes gene_type:complete